MQTHADRGLLEQHYIELQATSNTNEREAILADIRTIIGSIDIKRSELQIQRSNLSRIIENRLQSIAIQNSQINTTNILAANEQIVNAINLQYLTTSNLKLSATQTDLLFSVANQCPKLGGRYVYKARTLYNVLVADIKFNDEELCQNSDIIEERREEIQGELTPRMTLFPNPSYNAFNIKIEDISESKEYSIKLYDLAGQLIQDQVIDSNLETTTINQLKQGIYLCALFEDGIQIDVQKIVIL